MGCVRCACVSRQRARAALIDAALTHASRDWGVEQINLCVNTENEPAKALYASLGFETFGVERRAMRVGDRFYDEQHMVRVRR